MAANRSAVRTSSVSSGTASEQGTKKKFACDFPNCGKSFSRSEHLHRHALNHRDGNNTCKRCSAHFRRRDLLDRHMARHKEKDDEAGGEGLGVLATRKRLWRDADGNIVNTRRPYQQEGAKRRQLNSSTKAAEGQKQVQPTSPTTVDHAALANAAPPSPPTSIPSTASGALPQDSWPLEPSLPSHHDDCADQFDFLCNASWGTQPFQDFLDNSDLPYDDIFKPDTAMSFNAPFTTQSYYSWLFENDGLRDSNNNQPAPTDLASGSIGNNLPPQSLDPHLLASTYNQATPYLPSGNSNMDLENSMHLDLSRLQAAPHDPIASGTSIPSAARQQPPDSQNTGPKPHNDHTSFVTSAYDSAHASSLFSGPPLQGHPYLLDGSTASASSPSQRSASLNVHRLPDAYAPRQAGKLPIITREARDGILQIIVQARPIKPDGCEISPSDPLLSISSLQHYSDLFFTRFNSSYPLVHQSTFHSTSVHPLYLMSILLLGATYSDKEAHLLAVCVHDVMRPLIQASKEFGTRPSLWMLQTTLLVECFGKNRAGEKQHDMSHLYHGMLINLIRRSDCQSASVPAYDEQSHDLEHYWHMAVEAEQKRRLAMLCFMWDTQHAVLFSQSLCMNASELKTALPWDTAMWEASSASEWLFFYQSTPPSPQYLKILKSYTNPSSITSVPQHLNALSRVLILHGLMSISWDLQRRDQTSLGLNVSRSQTNSWQFMISACYNRWRVDFDVYTTAVLNSLSFNPDQAARFQRFTIASLAVYHTAQLVLNVDIVDLQIRAGAKHIIGRPVTGLDRARSQHRISEWINHDGGERVARATWHAGWLFRDGVRKLENWNVDDMFHYPWCLYLASLICWTFHDAAVKDDNGNGDIGMATATATATAMAATATATASDSDSAPVTGMQYELDDEDSDWDSSAEMNALISALSRLDPARPSFTHEAWAVAAKSRTAGLVRCMVKQLNTVRWAVVREGMIVLRGLVG